MRIPINEDFWAYSVIIFMIQMAIGYKQNITISVKLIRFVTFIFKNVITEDIIMN